MTVHVSYAPVATKSLPQLRLQLAARLRARRAELEGEILTRLRGIADNADADPTYLDGLHAAVGAALDYVLDAIECGEELAPPPPPALLAQARLAARSGIGLQTVLRRYLAGHTLLGDFVVEEVETLALGRGVSLKRLLRDQAALLDRLLADVSEEYEREAAHGIPSREERRIERVERLLAGELLDASALQYDFDTHHTGVIAAGLGAAEAIRLLASTLDCRLLLVEPDEEAAWAWLGSRRPLEVAEAAEPMVSAWSGTVHVALGESGEGISGWRLTHRQARAALTVARRRAEPLTRYANVALLACALGDEALATSLYRLWLAPLEVGRSRGETAKATLRAYLAAGRNVSSTAVALGVKRHTVGNRLREVEAKLGCPLDACLHELELALQLDELPEIAEIDRPHVPIMPRRASPNGHIGRALTRLGSRC